MNLNDIVLCRYENCNQIYDNPVFLPCGKRTCSTHIENMKIKSENRKQQNEIIKCFFCMKAHLIPEEGFPSDDVIQKILKIELGTQHKEAKKSFDNLNKSISNFSDMKNEKYLFEFFEKNEIDIELDREQVKLKIDEYYNELITELKKQKFECLEKFKTNYFNNFWLNEVNMKLKDFKFDLFVWNGRDQKWSEIKNECDKLNKQFEAIKKEFQINFLNDIRFIPSKNEINLKEICGCLSFKTCFIDSKILNEKNKNDLIELCSFQNSKFHLVYRASQDGFSAKTFHSKCDKIPNTITILKTTNNYIFGGYTDACWGEKPNDNYIEDSNAFIFSLVNQENQPALIKCKNPSEAIYNNQTDCAIFGYNDIWISNNSNINSYSGTQLGKSYESTRGKHFLTGSKNFKTVEIEVFKVEKF